MRVTQIVRGFGPGGGISGVAYELHNALTRRGFDARVITGKLSGGLALPNDSVKFVAHRLVRFEDRSPSWKRLVLPFSTFVFALWSSWYARRHQAEDEIVLNHGDSFVGNILIMHSVHEASLRLTIETGRYLSLLYPLHWWVLIRNWLQFRFHLYDRVVVVGNRLKQELRRAHRVAEEEITYIPNGIDTEKFSPGVRQQRVRTRRELGLPPDASVLLFAGHEFERKGLEVVLRAVAICKSKPYLLVVGADDPSPYVRLADRLRIGDRVIFAGPRKDMPQIYAASDMLVFPTRYEAFPLVCIEALSSGLPIIATRAGGIEDYLIDGENGFLVDRTREAMADRIDRLIHTTGLCQRMSQSARETALDYSWDRIAERYIALMRKVREEASPSQATGLAPQDAQEKLSR
jgi:glycosyltransferase involved in cell wall biosynthesis